MTAQLLRDFSARHDRVHNPNMPPQAGKIMKGTRKACGASEEKMARLKRRGNISAYTVRARRLRYAGARACARRASYGRHGGADRDRGERRDAD
ncbi:hypothetical protein PUN4_330059 [Paraburkholderia unamae]|nr:hypothetical protein PUN4_330059 [Paraburkholderia unamae]